MVIGLGSTMERGPMKSPDWLFLIFERLNGGGELLADGGRSQRDNWAINRRYSHNKSISAIA